MEKRNFFEAYKKVVANKGSSGIDGMRVDEQLERRGHRFCRYADDCAPQRWHELNTGVCTERGKPWADVKRVYQAEEPELFSFKGKSTLKGGGAYARNKAV